MRYPVLSAGQGRSKMWAQGTERGTVVEFSLLEVREERSSGSSRALPREESTRRFVRWLVSPRLATTSDLYPYMLSGVIDYRERSISKVQRSSCDSPPRLPSAFVTISFACPPPSSPLHSRAVIYTSESRLLLRQRYMEGCELIRGSSWIYEVFGILWYLHVSRDSIFTGIDDFVDEMFKKFKNEKILKTRRLVKLARKKRWRIWGGKMGETMIGMQKAIDNRGRYQRLIEMITRLGGPLSSPSAHLRLLYEHAN